MIRRRAVLAAAFDADAGGVAAAVIDLDGLIALPGNAPGSAPQTGTKALMLAVLDNGIASYLSREPRGRTEAEYWVLSPQRHSPFSFTVVCETLGLDPSAVRAALQRQRDGDARGHILIGRRRGTARLLGRLTTAKAGRAGPVGARRSEAGRSAPSAGARRS